MNNKYYYLKNFNLNKFMKVLNSSTLGILDLPLLLSLKKIGISRIFKKANFFLKKINMRFKDNEIQYLLLLRLIPKPYIIQNSIIVILNVNLRMFIFTTIVGITPFVALYSLAGFKLKEIISKKGHININDLINYENFIIIGLLIIFIIISIVLKKKLK